MLQVPSRNIGLPQPIRPIPILRAVSIKHSNTPIYVRASQAAAWLSGAIIVVPTLELAAQTFDVSRATVAAARKSSWSSPPSSAPGFMALGWAMASDSERAKFCAAYEPAVWRALEHVTDHQEI
jgi:hypothetical protein